MKKTIVSLWLICVFSMLMLSACDEEKPKYPRNKSPALTVFISIFFVLTIYCLLLTHASTDSIRKQYLQQGAFTKTDNDTLKSLADKLTFSASAATAASAKGDFAQDCVHERHVRRTRQHLRKHTVTFSGQKKASCFVLYSKQVFNKTRDEVFA